MVNHRGIPQNNRPTSIGMTTKLPSYLSSLTALSSLHCSLESVVPLFLVSSTFKDDTLRATCIKKACFSSFNRNGQLIWQRACVYSQ